ncbi:hypothetical protein ASZ90_004276 [hydrocarbon metagenome]|uniref:Uncharacterized protein n=1 Tax=hydrocarbon metagenome TaxID=938273 RepID=A0A0W8FYK4_9ZZZZ
MKKTSRDLSRIIHISRDVHNKLKRFVTDKQIKGESSSLAKETEIAILNHIKNKV